MVKSIVAELEAVCVDKRTQPILPFNFWTACKIVSVAATVPAPDVKPVKTLPITAEFVSVVANEPVPVPVASPVRVIVWSPVFVPELVPEHVPPPRTTVPVASGSVITRLAVSVVVVIDETKLLVPPALGDNLTASCVDAAIAVTLVNVPAAGVVPPMAPGDGNEVTLAVPSNALPPIVREVCSAVAVPALPDTLV